MQVPPDQRPIIFGEVLFDCFPEKRVLGGAPFNVAWNLRGLGGNPLVITAVGDDELGREVLQRTSDWGIDSAGLQVCGDKPTGRVDIKTENGEPSYQFWDDVAFDHIQFDTKPIAAAHPSLLYHGTLALRSQVSRQSLLQIRNQLDQLCHATVSSNQANEGCCPTFIDVNIRLPHYDPALASLILNDADHVKLNHDELNLLTGTSIQQSISAVDSWQLRRQLGERLMKQFRIKNLWITAAEEGAAWLGAKGDFVYAAAPMVNNLVDTVGAGDALTAVIIHGLLTQRDHQQILNDATRFAAQVCSIRGAISHAPDFYASALSR